MIPNAYLSFSRKFYLNYNTSVFPHTLSFKIVLELLSSELSSLLRFVPLLKQLFVFLGVNNCLFCVCVNCYIPKHYNTHENYFVYICLWSVTPGNLLVPFPFFLEIFILESLVCTLPVGHAFQAHIVTVIVGSLNYFSRNSYHPSLLWHILL